MTKAEQKILQAVRDANESGLLAALGCAPGDGSLNDNHVRFRFVKRLNDKGSIVWMPWSEKFGAGWALAEYVEQFYVNGYRPL
jgi:hypothetical protein